MIGLAKKYLIQASIIPIIGIHIQNTFHRTAYLFFLQAARFIFGNGKLFIFHFSSLTKHQSLIINKNFVSLQNGRNDLDFGFWFSIYAVDCA